VAEPAPRNIPELFLERVGRSPDAEAFRHPLPVAGDPSSPSPSPAGGWRSLTWAQTEARVRAVAGGLRALGLPPERPCAILASTRIEWILADLGILFAGGATTTIYPSSTAEECAFILSDSGSAIAFAENDEQVGKLLARRAELPSLAHVVTFDGSASADGWVLTLRELEERGRRWDADHPGAFEERAAEIAPDALATLIYTSGTTGRPKGVELTHAAWLAQSRSIQESGFLEHPEVFQFFWLPLAHVFGKMIGTAQLRIGFPTAVDGRVDKLVENLAATRPTFVCAVPRIFEKVHAKVLQNASAGGPLKEALFRWALDVGLRASRLERAGGRPGALLAAQRAVADRLVFQKVRALFGGRLRFFVSGSAPLSKDIAEFFDAMGVAICEGYGLTESSAATHANLPWARRIGTVGTAFAGIETRIAADGEILMRGPWIMRGYRGLPDRTREALDEEGWLHTGDVGFLDADGYLTITDRKKDLIKTSGGKYVAPAELESKLKATSRFVAQVLVHGDRRNYVSALVTLDAEAIGRWAAANGLAGKTVAELAREPAVKALLQEDLDRLNAGLPRFATVKKFAILSREFLESEGEVTASQKLKRKLIESRYRAELDALYPG
jgi:long-chain acyl-CoA synthetase